MLHDAQVVGINRKLAQTIGISVDHRRTNKSAESLALNSQRLKDYKDRLVLFPRRSNRVKKGDATKAEIAASKLDASNINTIPKAGDVVTFTTISDVSLHYFKVYTIFISFNSPFSS
jgi:Ribosomal protein L13e